MARINLGNVRGLQGVSVQSIEQTTTSTESSGDNVITCTLDNGIVSYFHVRNGDKGEDGEAATIALGAVTTGEAGSNVIITNSGTNLNARFNFTIPRGDKGDAGTIDVGTVTTGNPGTNASITNVGTRSDALLNFVIPRGDKGDTSTITIGTVTTGSVPSVTNSGTSTDAIFDFVFPNSVTSVSELTDVELSSLSDNQLLVYDSTSEKWENSYLPAGIVFPSYPSNDQRFYYMGDTTYTYTNVSATLTPSDNPSTASYFEYDEVNNEYNPSADLYVDESKTYYTIASDTPTSDPQAEGFYELDGTKYVASTDTTVDSGKTYYKASIATVVRGDNPKTMGLYETDGTDYSLTNDEYVVSGKNYFTRAEQYVTGVIYKYNTASTSWVPQTAGDTYIPITKSQIDSLFD